MTSTNQRHLLTSKALAWLGQIGLVLALLALPLAQAHGSPQKTQPTSAKASKKSAVKTRQIKSAAKKHSAKKRHSKATLKRPRQRVKVVFSSRRSQLAAHSAAIKPAPFRHLSSLHLTPATLKLKSNAVLVVDQNTREVLYSKNERLVLPIASLTKLMTGLLIIQAQLPMDEPITITAADVDTERHSSSRLRVGSTLTRGELLHLALMASENRAAHALARTAPGGLTAFVAQMNAKARALGMLDTVYVEPTGLSSANRSSARDLVKLVDVAHKKPLLRQLSTSPEFEVDVGRRTLQFNNTNRLVKNPSWNIGLQKTGYINEAGRCLVMQTKIGSRSLIMVFLDSVGKLTRIADAQRVRHWLETNPHQVSAQAETLVAGG